MKKLFTLLVVAVMGFAAMNVNAQSLFAKNDLLGSVTLGFGDGFGQRFAVDYCVVDGWLDGKASLGIGASLNNTISWNFDVDGEYKEFTSPYSGLFKVRHTDGTYLSQRYFLYYLHIPNIHPA